MVVLTSNTFWRRLLGLALCMHFAYVLFVSVRRGSLWHLEPGGLPRQFTYDSLFLSIVTTAVLVLGAFLLRKSPDRQARLLLQTFAVVWFCFAWAHAGFIVISQRSKAPEFSVEAFSGVRPRATELLTPEGALSLVEAGQPGSGSLATLAEVLRRNGDRARALDTFRLATAGDDAYLEAQLGVARCLGLLGDFDGAEVHLRGLLRRYQDESVRAYLHYWLAVALLTRKDERLAVEELRRSVQLQPQIQEYWTELGLALVDTGTADEAEAALERSVAINNRGPSAAMAYVALAEIAHRRGASEEEVYAFLVKSMYATWVRPPDHLLPYLNRRWPISNTELSAQR